MKNHIDKIRNLVGEDAGLIATSKAVTDPHKIVESILGEIDWENATRGICHCPGEALHTNRNSKRDTQVYLDGAPTIHCHHSSCSETVRSANGQLRSAFGKSRMAGGAVYHTVDPEQLKQQQVRRAEKRKWEELARRSKESLPAITEKFSGSPADLWEESPVRLLAGPEDDGRLLLHLFDPEAIVWIGDTYDSANEHSDTKRKECAAAHFKQAGEWLDMNPAPQGPFICPSTFEVGSYSRSNANVLTQPFYVYESDSLSHEEAVGVINYLRLERRLRAVVNTGGKSLHAWFDRPDESLVKEDQIIMEGLGGDAAVFKPAQPVRLPGCKRYKMEGNKPVFVGMQTLLYLDI